MVVSKFLKNLLQNLAHSLGYHIMSKNGITGSMPLFLKALRKRGLVVKNILDVGAHDGQWSYMAAQIFPNANYYMIEPQVEMKEKLDQFYNNHNGKWYLGAAGAAEGSLSLTVWPDFAGSSLLGQGTR